MSPPGKILSQVLNIIPSPSWGKLLIPQKQHFFSKICPPFQQKGGDMGRWNYDNIFLCFGKVAKIKLISVKVLLKLVSAIFCQIFILSPNDSPSKTTKMILNSPKKLFSFLRYSNFCNFSSSFPHFPHLKGEMEVEQFMMSWIGLHKFSGVMFGITQKPLCYNIKLGQIIYKFLWTCFITWRATGH